MPKHTTRRIKILGLGALFSLTKHDNVLRLRNVLTVSAAVRIILVIQKYAWNKQKSTLNKIGVLCVLIHSRFTTCLKYCSEFMLKIYLKFILTIAYHYFTTVKPTSMPRQNLSHIFV